MKKQFNGKILFVFGMLMVGLVTIISFSFAYVSYEGESNEPFGINGSTATLPDITFTENKEGNILTNTYPVTDEIGLTHEAYTYTIRNDEDRSIKVNVLLEVTAESTLEDSLVNFALDDVVNTLGSISKTTPTKSSYKNSYIIQTLTLAAGETKSTSLKLWINENGTIENAQNKTWSSKVTVLPSFNQG